MSAPTSLFQVRRQTGFTLFELLIALFLVLIIFIAAQRYIAGVTVDYEGISERRDHATQVRIGLSNIQRDIAQAGFFPLASSDMNIDVGSVKNVGIKLTGNEMSVSSYQPKSTAFDCNRRHNSWSDSNDSSNNDEQPLQAQGWIYVENIYSIVDDSLACNGNGDKDSDRFKVLNGIKDIQITAQLSKEPHYNQLIHLCLVVEDSGSAIGGVPTTTNCNGESLSNVSSRSLFYKTHIDMPVYASSFQVGQ